MVNIRIKHSETVRIFLFTYDYGSCFFCPFAIFLIICSYYFLCFLYIRIYGSGIFR